MKQANIGQQWARSVLAIFAVFVLFGFVFSSCEKGNDELAKREAANNVVYVSPEKVVTKGCDDKDSVTNRTTNDVYVVPSEKVIAKGKELIAMSDRLIVKAKAVKDEATDPKVSVIRDNFEVIIDIWGFNKNLARVEIEWVEHIIKGGTKSELNRYSSKLVDDKKKLKSKIVETRLKLKQPVKDDSSLFPDLTNAINDYNETESKYRNGVFVEYTRIADEFNKIMP
jgi:hypothetical protein